MQTRKNGFTLIELMIAVAIVGILAAIAYPSYLNQVRKSRRTDAQSLLLKAANREERFYTTEHKYASSLNAMNLPSLTENEAYSAFASYRDGDDQTFQIMATAQNDQTKDMCVTYSINDIGEKKAKDSAGNDVSDSCW